MITLTYMFICSVQTIAMCLFGSDALSPFSQFFVHILRRIRLVYVGPSKYNPALMLLKSWSQFSKPIAHLQSIMFVARKQ